MEDKQTTKYNWLNNLSSKHKDLFIDELAIFTKKILSTDDKKELNLIVKESKITIDEMNKKFQFEKWNKDLDLLKKVEKLEKINKKEAPFNYLISIVEDNRHDEEFLYEALKIIEEEWTLTPQLHKEILYYMNEIIDHY